MLIYHIYYLVLLVIGLISANDKRILKYTLRVAFLALFLMAALRGPNVDRDYKTYLYNIYMLLNKLEYSDYKNLIYYEPSYFILPYIVSKLSNTFQLFFAFYAFLGVWLKLKSTYLSNSFFLSLLLYYTSWFFLHEMTQIRAGVAIGILCLSINDIYQRNIGSFLFKLILACFFHYSSILFLPLYFLNPHSIRKYLLLFILLVSFILAYNKFNIFSNSFINFFDGTKIDTYSKLAKSDEKLWSVFNGGFILNSVISIMILIKIDKIIPYNKYAILLVKINTLSIVIYLLFSAIPILSIRFSELYGIVQVFLFPCLIYVFRHKLIGYVFIILLSMVYLYTYTYYSHTIEKYLLFFNQ